VHASQGIRQSHLRGCQLSVASKARRRHGNIWQHSGTDRFASWFKGSGSSLVRLRRPRSNSYRAKARSARRTSSTGRCGPGTQTTATNTGSTCQQCSYVGGFSPHRGRHLLDLHDCESSSSVVVEQPGGARVPTFGTELGAQSTSGPHGDQALAYLAMPRWSSNVHSAHFRLTRPSLADARRSEADSQCACLSVWEEFVVHDSHSNGMGNNPCACARHSGPRCSHTRCHARSLRSARSSAYPTDPTIRSAISAA
jgi:hypothetical protein